MQRYATSKLRLVLLGVFLAAGVFVTTGYGQASGADQTTQTVQSNNLFTLILSHWIDPVFWTIAILSVTALTLIIQGFITNRATVMLPEASTNQIRELIEQRKFKDLLDFTESDPSFVSGAINAALKRASGGFVAMKEAMETAIGEQTAEQFRKIEYLNIIGNLGPLLGLLGTVLGMIEAFEAMHAAGGQAKPSELAHGISTALTHTFLGLFLAIPCLAAFGILRTMVDRLTVKGALIAEEMLLMLKPAEQRQAAPVARAMPAAPQPQVAGVAPGAVRRPPTMPAPSPLVSG
jgi:biopolymer transport protein ExbB